MQCSKKCVPSDCNYQTIDKTFKISAICVIIVIFTKTWSDSIIKYKYNNNNRNTYQLLLPLNINYE